MYPCTLLKDGILPQYALRHAHLDGFEFVVEPVDAGIRSRAVLGQYVVRADLRLRGKAVVVVNKHFLGGYEAVVVPHVSDDRPEAILERRGIRQERGNDEPTDRLDPALPVRRRQGRRVGVKPQAIQQGQPSSSAEVLEERAPVAVAERHYSRDARDVDPLAEHVHVKDETSFNGRQSLYLLEEIAFLPTRDRGIDAFAVVVQPERAGQGEHMGLRMPFPEPGEFAFHLYQVLLPAADDERLGPDLVRGR